MKMRETLLNLDSAREIESARPVGYLALLLGLLMSVTIFETYDITIFHLCTPNVARAFHLDNVAVGAMASLVRFGGMWAVVMTMTADRIGRRPIVMATVLFYTVFTLLTALSRGAVTFTLFQSLAQLFLQAEYAVAVIMISEEFPNRWRGRGIALLDMIGLLGVVVAGELYGYVAPSRFGWRGMYLIGIVPLLVIAFLRRKVRETARFERIERERLERPHHRAVPSLAESLGLAVGALGGPYKRRLLLIALLWNSLGIVSVPTATFFSLYARRDHHWTSSEVGQAVVFAYLIGTFGHLVAGYLLDRIGRKSTASCFYVASALSVFSLFHSHDHRSMVYGFALAVFMIQGGRTATATYSAELFPTEIRATAYGFVVQVLGQFAALLSPLTIGMLAHALGGLGNAVAALAGGPIVGAILITLFGPETRGRSLEEHVLAHGPTQPTPIIPGGTAS